MRREERVWCELLARVARAPVSARHVACDALWSAVIATEGRAEIESIALILYGLDGVAREVPHADNDRLWRGAAAARRRPSFN